MGTCTSNREKDTNDVIYFEKLLGYHIIEAENFIKEHKVYYNSSDIDYRITEIRVLSRESYMQDGCLNRINVKIDENNNISEILWLE